MYGLRPAVIATAESFRAAGHEVTTPDLYDGRVAQSIDEGFAICDDVGWETIMRRARDAVRNLPDDAVLAGLSMGVGVATELLDDRPHPAGLLMLHGIGRVADGLPVQVHVGEEDMLFPPAEVAAWQSTVPAAEVFTYPAIGHFFTDPGSGDFDEAAAGLAWQRALSFVGAL